MTDRPAPLTTPETDVRGLNGFLLDTERLMASELWHVSTGEEFKAAVTLWCRAWKQTPPGSLPNDDRMLASYAGVSAATWRRIRDVALRGFVLCSDGRLYNKTLCEDVLRAHARKAEYRARTAAATAAAAEKKRNRHGSVTDDVTGSQGGGTVLVRDLEGAAAAPGARADGSPPPPSSGSNPEPAAATAAPKVVSSVEPIDVREALARGDLLDLVRAFGCNVASDRPPEWLRETDGLTLHTVAVILGWQRGQRRPIREPSGFRAARQTWRETLDDDYRTDLALEVLGGLGVEMPTVRPSTRTKP